MLSNYLARTFSLNTKLAQGFAKFDRSKPHINGKSLPIQLVLSATSTMARPR
jgi:hypothetical protein